MSIMDWILNLPTGVKEIIVNKEWLAKYNAEVRVSSLRGRSVPKRDLQAPCTMEINGVLIRVVTDG
jgi:hypothetical protein